MHLKDLFQKLCLLGIFLLLFTHPRLSASYAAKGLLTWYTSIVPILLPAMILTGLLIRTKACCLLHPIAAPVFSRLFHLPGAAADAWLVGMLCGYPSGAAVTGELYRQNLLTATEASRLLQFCCYPSPMFLSGVVLQTALEGQVHSACFFGAVYLGGICTGLIAGRRKCSESRTETIQISPYPPAVLETSFFSKLEESLMAASRTILIVGLYLMLFQILSGLAAECFRLPDLWTTLVTGILEMTGGVLMSASLPLPLFWKSTLMLFLVVFGGISTYLQSVSILGEEAFLAKRYLTGRLIHSSLSAAIYGILFFAFMQ